MLNKHQQQQPNWAFAKCPNEHPNPQTPREKDNSPFCHGPIVLPTLHRIPVCRSRSLPCSVRAHPLARGASHECRMRDPVDACGHSLLYATPLSWKSRVVDLMARNGMLPLWYQIMTSNVLDDDDDDAERRLRMVVEISIAIGGEGGVVEVQLVEAEGREEKEWVCERRGVRLSLYRAMCEAIMGRCRQEKVERMWRFGMHVGVINETLLLTPFSKDKVSKLSESLVTSEFSEFEDERIDEVLGLLQSSSINGR